MYTSTLQSGAPSANAALPPHPRLQTSYPPICLCPLTTVSCSGWSFYAFCFPSPLTLSGFFYRMLEVFESGALNYFTFSRLILSTLCATRNPILTHLPLFRFLDSLLCILIAPTSGLAFSLQMPLTLAAALSSSSGRAYLSLNLLLPLFLYLIPTLIM